MEEYEDIENDAYDATASTAAAGRQDQTGQIARQLGIEVERSQSANPGVLKTTSGNVAKRLKMRQETRVTTRAGKTAEASVVSSPTVRSRTISRTTLVNGLLTTLAEAAIKQIAAQELQAEKGRMQEWKQIVMQEVGHGLQAIRQAHEEVMEAQRHGFNVEIEMAKERLRQEEMQSALFANEIKALKAQKQAPDQRPSQDTPTARNMPAAQASPKPNDGTKSRNKRDEIDEIGDSRSPGSSQGQVDISATPDPPSSSTNSRVKRRDYASVAVSKPVKIPEQPWTQVNYGTRKSKGKQSSPGSKQEQLGRRILFPRDSGQERSEADLMLALNEALQQAGVETYIRFSRVRYAPSGAISALLTEKADAGQLIPQRSNLLIRAAKSVDPAVVG
ncbi:hypothetical protein MMC31_006676, partial [Peltigera leucophlebia]|nr:hypothetical protein [Peltigera leucophlebia]